MTVEVRLVRDEDWPALFSLWVEAWTALLPAIDFRARLPWFRTYVDGLQAAGAAVSVAAENEKPLGFVTVDPGRQDMDQLAIAPEAQRQGVGRCLVRAAKTQSPGGLTLKVVQMNRPAIALYRSEGFVITGSGVSERSGLANFGMRWRGAARGQAEARSSAR